MRQKNALKNIIQEDYIGGIPPIRIEKITKMLSQLDKCICKVEKEKNKKICTGFLCKIHFPDEFSLLPVFITAKHAFEKEELEPDKVIKITFYKNSISKFIKLSKERKILSSELDVIIIEIKPKIDKIESFLDIDEDAFKDNYKNCKNSTIYVLQFPKGESSLSVGKMDINGKNIIHYCSTNFGSSGSPILSYDSYRVIGIHRGKSSIGEYNVGTLIKYPMEEFIKKYYNPKKDSGKKKPIKINVEKGGNYVGKPKVKKNMSQKDLAPKKMEDKKDKSVIIKNIIEKNKMKPKEIIKKNKDEKDDHAKNDINIKEVFKKKNKNFNNKPISLKSKEKNDNNQIYSKTFSSPFMKNVDKLNNHYNNNSISNDSFSIKKDIFNIIEITVEKEFGLGPEDYYKFICNNYKYTFDELNQNNTELYINNIKLNFVNKYVFPIGISSIKIIIKTLVYNMESMFYDCPDLKSIDFTSFNTINVYNMSLMFYRCSNLTSINLSSFDTRKVTDMSGMFKYCTNLVSVNLSSFDTRKVTDMSRMFEGCTNLVYLNLSSFDTRNVTNMFKMFSDCKALKILNLSLFDMTNIKDYAYMFSKCYDLEIIRIKKKNRPFINKEILQKDFVEEAKIEYI